MVTVTAVLKAVSLFVAELISSFSDWFQTTPAWANLEVLEDTELKSTGGGESENRNAQKSHRKHDQIDLILKIRI